MTFILKTPSFWYRQKPGAIAWMLLPPAWLLLGLGALRRWYHRLRQLRLPLPVICIGNITAGGTGKTPLVMALAKEAKRRGMNPVILTRGHGGEMAGPVPVRGDMTAHDIGDEALMMAGALAAMHIPVVVARRRRAGAELILRESMGDIIIMDDGMQNDAIMKNTTIACFNGRLGMGNGLPIPAGPLREMPGDDKNGALARAHAVAISGDDTGGIAARLAGTHPRLPVFTIRRRLRKKDIAAIGKVPVVAFAGIGDGAGFFAMLEAAGVRVVASETLADHAPVDTAMLMRLRGAAEKHGARLVTTEKDAARAGDVPGLHTIGLDVDIPAGLPDSILPSPRKSQAGKSPMRKSKGGNA